MRKKNMEMISEIIVSRKIAFNFILFARVSKLHLRAQESRNGLHSHKHNLSLLHVKQADGPLQTQFLRFLSF